MTAERRVIPLAAEPGPTCRAPAVSLYFEVDGSVLACCHNRLHPLGSVPQQSLDEIWRGDARSRMRSWLDDGDLSHGCDACAHEIDAGNRAGATAATFDRFEPGDWPTRLEFALSNRCNLACVMCNGNYSSRIRAEREQLPPLVSPYGDSFFEQLRPFLPHLTQARFYGGEPLLIPEYQRIWDLMVETGSRAECNVTTNGTVRTPRVEATLGRLPFSIGVSVDGMTPSTVERIRHGASFATIMANIHWFREYCEARGTFFGLTYCLMTENVHEFADFLRFAEDIGAGVAVNRVTQPTRYSLFHLPADELSSVVRDLRASTAAQRLGRHAAVWEAQLSVLDHHLATLEASPASHPDLAALVARLLADAPFADEEAVLAALARVAPGQRPSALRTDQSDVARSTVDGSFLGIAEAQFLGRPAAHALTAVAAAHGQQVVIVADHTDKGATARVLRLGSPDQPTAILAVTTASGSDAAQRGQIHAAVMVPARV